MIDKICFRCGKDCSAGRRSKDANGRYICGACLDKAEAKRAGQPIPFADQPAFEQGRDPDTSSGAPFQVAQAANTAPIELTPADPASAKRPCPGCKEPISPETPVCPICQYDFFTRRTPRGGGSTCRKCGYDLSGVVAPKCPECGVVIAMSKREHDRQSSRDVARETYQRPIVIFAIAATLTFIGYWASADFEQAVMQSVFLIAFVPIGVAAYWICCATFLGFDAPMHVVGLQLASVYAIVEFVQLLMHFVPIPILPMAVVSMVYLGCLMSELDLELSDAVIMALITFLLRLGAVVALALAGVKLI